jgi:hypothetical protein
MNSLISKQKAPVYNFDPDYCIEINRFDKCISIATTIRSEQTMCTGMADNNCFIHFYQHEQAHPGKSSFNQT